MQPDFVQDLRYKLQKRYRRFHGASESAAYSALRSWWEWVIANETLHGIVADLRVRAHAHREHFDKLLTHEQAWSPDTEAEAVGIGLLLVEHYYASTDKPDLITHFGRAWDQYKRDESLTLLRELYCEPLYEYLDEQLDDQRSILGLLRRFKHRCEWFDRHELFDAWQSNPSKGEASLCRAMYRYLHDQGFTFTIEPTTASGNPDFIAVQDARDPLVADAKVFCPERDKAKPYLCHAVKQVYTYACDLNQPFGYVVVFKTSERDLRWAIDTRGDVPFAVHNNKTIFIVTIDLFPHAHPASKRGALDPIEITSADLFGDHATSPG